MRNWQANGQYVIVEPKASNESPESRLILAGDPGIGVVISPPDVSDYTKGDEILYGSFNLIGHPSLPEGQKLIHADDVLAYRIAE